jgi:hypothetical protein
MSWTTIGPAITTSTGVVLETTSTSTILTRGRLRTFLARPTGRIGGLTPSTTVPVLDGGEDAAAYIESDASYLFSSVDNSDVHQTAIPCIKRSVARVLQDGISRTLYSEYQDVQVLELPRGMGWLMLLVRYLGEVEWTGNGRTQNNSVGSVVGYWCAEPSFTSPDIRGPYWLVGRNHSADGVNQDPVWLGVPAACILQDGGLEYLYIYFAAELTSFSTSDGGISEDSATTTSHGFVGGTWAPRTRLRTFTGAAGVEWVAPSVDFTYETLVVGTIVQASRLLGRGASASYMASVHLRETEELRAARDREKTLTHASIVDTYGDDLLEYITWTDEATWDLSNENLLLPGTNLGKVRVWVATGSPFWPGDDPATNPNSNTEFEDYYTAVKLVDAVPVLTDTGLVLYFSANQGPGATTGKYGYGVWCAVAVPKDSTSAYGLDFAVYPSEMDSDTGEHDVVFAGVNDADRMLRGGLDPDPVQLPDGTWVVALGDIDTVDPENPTVTYMRVEGTEPDGEPTPDEPWT